MIKCVIWDIDNTLLDGVYLESGGEPPAASQVLVPVLRELAGRGILHAVASRNPPEAAAYVAELTGVDFAAAECGWDAKPEAIRRILAELGFTADAVAFVDDEALERAEVSYALPQLLVLSPEDAAGMAGWPEFSPAVVTDEARRRAEIYAARRRREREARAFGGSRDDFLRHSRTSVVIGPAAAADAPRLHELSERTHQLNSAGAGIGQQEMASLIGAPHRRVVTVRLSDAFADDGLVGGCVIDTSDPAAWRVPMLMMSCRAMGRGVIDALLAWLCRAAAAGGARFVTIPCLVTARNVPLRIALSRAGFRAGDVPAGGPAAVPPASAAGTASTASTPGAASPSRPGGRAGPATAGEQSRVPGMALFTRPVTGDLPELPGWASPAAAW
jgi:methoxymalonate biosynthesis protein